MSENTTNKGSGIYYEPDTNKLPNYYGRDVIKVLTKNPKEAFIFWGISEDSFSKIKDFFNIPLEEIRYKLHVRFSDEEKHSHFMEIYLPPFTTSYLVKFEYPVKNLRVEIIAFSTNGSTYSFLHSAHINMPVNKPSQFIHKEWIHPKWVQEGYIEKVEESYIIKSFIANKEHNPELLEENWTPEWESKVVHDGSSGFSSHSIPTSIRKTRSAL